MLYNVNSSYVASSLNSFFYKQLSIKKKYIYSSRKLKNWEKMQLSGVQTLDLLKKIYRCILKKRINHIISSDSRTDVLLPLSSDYLALTLLVLKRFHLLSSWSPDQIDETKWICDISVSKMISLKDHWKSLEFWPNCWQLWIYTKRSNWEHWVAAIFRILFCILSKFLHCMLI